MQLRSRYFDASLPAYAGYEIWRFRVERRHVPRAVETQEWSALGAPFFTIHLHVATDDGRDFVMGGTTIAKPERDLALTASELQGANRQAGPELDSVPAWFLPFYVHHFGAHAGGALVDTMRAAAEHGKITPLPLYEFAAAKVVSGRIVLVGDAAHMASPRTAVGAHTAVVDAASLFDAMTQAHASLSGSEAATQVGALVDRALAAYAPVAVKRAADLLARSREVSAPAAVQGWPYESFTPKQEL